MSSSEIFEIGDSYTWGQGIATTIAGFFFSTETRTNVALTVSPPHHSANCIPTRNRPLCCAILEHGNYINTIQGRDPPYKRISRTQPRFGDDCTIYKKDRITTARIIGNHRSVRVDGRAVHELFEFDTFDQLGGYAGAPVVVGGELAGLLVAVAPGRNNSRRGFFLSVSFLADQLTLLPRSHASDADGIGGFLNMVTDFRELDELDELEEVA